MPLPACPPFVGSRTYPQKVYLYLRTSVRSETRRMALEYGKGKLVPTGAHHPAIFVSYKISQQLVEATGPHGSFLRKKAVVDSIAAEPGQQIAFGDYDLHVGEEILRLKHVASDPEWLVLSSDVSAILA
jgi:hypothetical protein